MNLTKDTPNLTPVSDSSSSSSDYGNVSLLQYGVGCRMPDETVPGEVGGDSFHGELASATKHVSFGDLEVRKYPVILGDHPECSMGPPVSIF
jgi:hypothetical protein